MILDLLSGLPHKDQGIWSIRNDARIVSPTILRGWRVLSVGFLKKRLNLVFGGKHDREFEVYKRIWRGGSC
jgi:hypothetical protein